VQLGNRIPLAQALVEMLRERAHSFKRGHQRALFGDFGDTEGQRPFQYLPHDFKPTSLWSTTPSSYTPY